MQRRDQGVVRRGRRPSASRISNSEPRRVLPIAAAPTRNASASSPRAQNCFSTVFSGAVPGWVQAGVRRSARRGSTSARGDEFVFGHDHPRGGFHHDRRPVIDHDGHAGADQPGGYRVAGRAIPDTGEPVDLAGDRGRPDLRAAARAAVASSSRSVHRAVRRGLRRSPSAPRR